MIRREDRTEIGKVAVRTTRVVALRATMAAKSSKPTSKRPSKRPPAAASTTGVESTTTTSTAATTSARTPSHHEIAQRAFELFLARGRQHGRAQEDWLTAERELSARYSVN